MYDAYFNFLFLPMTIPTLKKIQRVTEPNINTYLTKCVKNSL